MAEEAFALSPISARPNLPGEADYEAIREAFMETARGRWFLAEYAKRNRTADTNILLDAVTRLEAGLAAQRQPQGTTLVAALGAIRQAVRQAKASAIEAMPRIDGDDVLTAARNGARIVREISWTLRECGADIRICDLLDTHVQAIEAGQAALNGDGRDEVLASYDLLMQTIEQLADGGPAAAEAAAPANTPPAAPEAREASVTPLFKPQAAEAPAEPAMAPVTTDPPVLSVPDTASIEAATLPAATADLTPAMAAASAELSAATADAPADLTAPAAEASAEVAAPMSAAPAAIVEAIADLAAAMAEASRSVAEPAELPQPDAMLDEELAMVAMEMAALDDSAPEMATAAPAAAPVEPPAAVHAAPMAAPAPVDADLMTLAEIAEAALAPEPAAAQPAPAPPASLGAALIASGMISRPASASDPLGPIRRMTQAETIAFFT